jgi:hypothetical protein
MPYAANGKVSTNPFEGAVEITQEQYAAALQGMIAGKVVQVEGGFAVVDRPDSDPEPDPAPDPDFIPESMTFAQLLIGLVAEGWITEAEGEAWLTGQVPAAVTALIARLPSNQRFAALARASRPSIILRSDPLVNALADLQGKADDMDGFFSTYAVA